MNKATLFGYATAIVFVGAIISLLFRGLFSWPAENALALGCVISTTFYLWFLARSSSKLLKE